MSILSSKFDRGSITLRFYPASSSLPRLPSAVHLSPLEFELTFLRQIKHFTGEGCSTLIDRRPSNEQKSRVAATLFDRAQFFARLLQQARQHATGDTDVWMEEDGEKEREREGFPAGPRTTMRVNRRTRELVELSMVKCFRKSFRPVAGLFESRRAYRRG